MLNDANLTYARKQSHFKAKQLIGNYGFTRDDLEDIRQDLLAELFRRLERFDPAKAGVRTFITRLLNNAVADLIERRRAQCRDYRRSTCRLDDWTEAGDEDGGWTTYAAQTTEADVKAHLRTEFRSESEALQLRMDVEAVIDRLPRDLRELSRHLQTKSVSQIAREKGVSRQSVYGSIRQLRRIFSEAGLGEYLAAGPTPRSVGR